MHRFKTSPPNKGKKRYETYQYAAVLGPKRNPVRFTGAIQVPVPCHEPERIKFEAMRRHVFGVARDEHGLPIAKSERNNAITFRKV